MTRVLIIDDCAEFRIMLREVLERAGYEVFEAADGEEGMETYRQNPDAVVLMDIIMPKKEGIETIFELRNEFPEAKIIAMSGGGELAPENYLALAKKAGVPDTFAKPIDTEAILATIRRLVNEKQTASQRIH